MYKEIFKGIDLLRLKVLLINENKINILIEVNDFEKLLFFNLNGF